MEKAPAGSNEGSSISDVSEAVNHLIEGFADLKQVSKEKWAEPPSEKYATDDSRAMAEDDATRLQIEPVEDNFAESWREEIDPSIKSATINALVEQGRFDVVKQIDKFDDVSSLVNAATLEKIRGK